MNQLRIKFMYVLREQSILDPFMIFCAPNAEMFDCIKELVRKKTTTYNIVLTLQQKLIFQGLQNKVYYRQY